MLSVYQTFGSGNLNPVTEFVNEITIINQGLPIIIQNMAFQTTHVLYNTVLFFPIF